MKKIHFLTLLFSFFLIFPNPANAQKKAQRFINKELKKDSLFRNAVVGILAVNEKGKTMAEWNPDYPLLTASTLKTITTGIALDLLGPDYRFETKIGYTGEIRDSTLYGDLYIIGGGDPTLGSSDTLAYPIGDIFSTWKDIIEEAGIYNIEGYIIGDDRFFTHEIIPESWSWGNLGASYGSGPSGLSFYENLQSFLIKPGETPGESAITTPLYPIVPKMNYEVNITTDTLRGRTSFNYIVSDLARNARLNGSIAINRDSLIRHYSNKYPAMSAAYHFKEFLKISGINCNDTIPDIYYMDAPSQDEIIILTTTYSPSLISIINVTNRISNNFYAETLFKMIGKHSTGVGSYDSAYVAIERYFEGIGLSSTGFSPSDGSGLSRQNYLSPRFFCNFYSKMEETKNFPLFFESFPYPGGPGTLSSVLRGSDETVKRRIHAKSGSLANVRCYAGYVEGRNGLIKFAILVNNYSAKTSEMQPNIEKFLYLLADY